MAGAGWSRAGQSSGAPNFCDVLVGWFLHGQADEMAKLAHAPRVAYWRGAGPLALSRFVSFSLVRVPGVIMQREARPAGIQDPTATAAAGESRGTGGQRICASKSDRLWDLLHMHHLRTPS